MPWDAQGEAQAALRTIVADPQYGPAALSDARTMTNLLKDLLPDAPRESSVLVAAAEAGVVGTLQAHLSQGMDVATASRLAAAQLEHQTALTPDASSWAVGALARALYPDSAADGEQQTVTAPAAGTGAEGTAEVAAVQAEVAAAQAETAAAEAKIAATRAEAAFARAPATAGSNGDQPLLRLVGIEKHFGPVRVLYDIDLDIPLGQVTALVGDNGAGKSTLIKTIAGIYQQDHGDIIWQGRPVRFHSPKDATDLGIATVYQDLALCDNLDIVQNMFLGREPVKHFQLDEVAMELQAKATLADLQVVTIRSVRQPVGSLSGGQRQAVAVAKAVLRQAQLVIMDEPTAALGVTQTRVVLDLIRRLKSQDIAVIVISHNLNDVQAVADRVAVLRLGRLVSVGPLAQYDSESIVDLMTTGTSKRLAAVPAEPSSGSIDEH